MWWLLIGEVLKSSQNFANQITRSLDDHKSIIKYTHSCLNMHMLTHPMVPLCAFAYPSSSTWYAVPIPNPLACPYVVYAVISCPTRSLLWCFSYFPASSSGHPAQFYLCPLCFHHSMHLGSQPHFHVFWPPTIVGELPERYQCLGQSWGLYKYLLSWARGSRWNLREGYILSAFFSFPPPSQPVKVPGGSGSWVSKHFISTDQCCPWQSMEVSTVLGGEMK